MATIAKKNFSYKAKDPTGNFIEGTIKAESVEQVKENFARRGFIPLDVTEESALSKDLSFGKKKVGLRDIAVFARQFATMSNAAIPVVKTLEILTSQSTNPTFQDILRQMTADVNEGITLADAMSKHRSIFSPIIISMVQAAEAGGFLNKALLSIAESLEAEVRLKAKIKSAMTYPVVIFVLAMLLTTGMLLFIVPVFQDMFASMGGTLPLPTLVLVFLSNVIKVGIVPFIILVVLFMSWWRKHKNDTKVREFVDPIKLKLPVFGKLNSMIIMARFAKNFADLLDAAVPLLQILDIVGASSGSIVLEKSLVKVKESILSGGTIVEPMLRDPIFPKMLVEMTAIGEDAGDLSGMLTKVSESYEYDVEAMTDQLSSLLEPIMLVFLGVIVGGMIVALYLPIFSVYDLVSKK